MSGERARVIAMVGMGPGYRWRGVRGDLIHSRLRAADGVRWLRGLRRGRGGIDRWVHSPLGRLNTPEHAVEVDVPPPVLAGGISRVQRELLHNVRERPHNVVPDAVLAVVVE